MRALCTDNSVIPCVVFLIPRALRTRASRIITPRFRGPGRLGYPRGQASLCRYTLLRRSVSHELTLGYCRYLFDSVPPQPSGPPRHVRAAHVSRRSKRGRCSMGDYPNSRNHSDQTSPGYALRVRTDGKTKLPRNCKGSSLPNGPDRPVLLYV